MDLLNIIHTIDPYMPRKLQHYKQKNTDTITYTNTTNKTITINNDTYTPRTILLYHINDTITLSIPVYNIQHTYKLEDIETIVIT